jgi:hypothetical protein
LNAGKERITGSGGGLGRGAAGQGGHGATRKYGTGADEATSELGNDLVSIANKNCSV